MSEPQFWIDKMNAGETRQQVAYDIINSPEHRSQEVNYFYQTLLNRPLDTTTDPMANVWINQLLNGTSEAAVVQGIMDSTEYQSTHTDNTRFVQDLYFDVLGRQASSAEVNTVVGMLTSGATRDFVESSVINSMESATRQVDGFYGAFFHRVPDSLENVWEQQLLGGTSAGQVEANMLADSIGLEFINDANATVK